MMAPVTLVPPAAQAARHHQADPAGPPGDDGDLAGEIEQVSVS
jgi:hypothetical protein